jgi:hypothetical protein
MGIVPAVELLLKFPVLDFATSVALLLINAENR